MNKNILLLFVVEKIALLFFLLMHFMIRTEKGEMKTQFRSIMCDKNY